MRGFYARRVFVLDWTLGAIDIGTSEVAEVRAAKAIPISHWRFSTSASRQAGRRRV